MKKSVITLLIFLIMIISVSAVSAADDAADLGASDDTVVSVANTDTAVTVDDNAKNFTDLSTDIAASGNIELSSDYIRNDSESMITIDKMGTIDGKGHTIDANGKGGIFEITARSTVTLKNMILQNATVSNVDDCGAIINHGILTLENVTFYNCVDSNGAAINSEGTLTVNNCIFNVAEDTQKGIITSGALSLSNNTYNNNENAAFVTLAYGSSLNTECTITVEASADEDNWKNIVYETSSIVDDNNNWIYLNEGVGTWAVEFNDNVITTPTTTYNNGGIKGKDQAVAYGANIIEISNDILPEADVVTASVDITPGKQSTEFNLNEADLTGLVWNDTVKIIFTGESFYDDDLGYLYPTGEINVTFTPGSKLTLELNDTGLAEHVIENIAVGSYSILIQYGGDKYFNAVNNNYQPAFTVNQKPIEEENINITVDQSTIGKQVITIQLPSDATGFITAVIAGETYLDSKDLADGKVSFDSELDPDNYQLKINYLSTGNYASDDYTIDFTVPKLTTEIVIDVENTTYGNNVTFNITLNKDVAKALVAVTTEEPVDVDFEEVELTNGTATINKGKLNAGNYIITVKALDDKYEDCTTNTTVNVAKFDPNMSMVIGEYALFENVAVNVTVKDVATGTTVNLVVNYGNNQKKEYTGTTDENGTVEFTIQHIEVGKNNIVATLAPTDTSIDAKSIEENITVAKLTPEILVTIKNTDERVNIGQDAKILVTLSNSETDDAPTGSILVTFKGQEFATSPLTDGVSQVITIPASEISELGEYTINVAYQVGDTNYNTNSTDFTFEVTKWDVDLSAAVEVIEENATFAIIVNYDGNDPSQNFTIAIKDANNETIKTVSVALEDVDEVNVTLPVGTYTAVISYPGDDEYYAANTTTDAFSIKGAVKELAIEILDVDYPKNATAVVTADVDGNYNITIGENKYTVTVKDGTGSVDLGVLAANDYHAVVVSIMDLYPSETNATDFTVNKGTVVATLTIANVDYPNKAIAYISADVDGTYTIKSESYFTDDVTVTVVNGTGNETLVELGAGTYTFALWGITGNDNYTNVKVDSVDFTVNKGTVDVNLTVEDILYTNATNINLNVSVGGTYTISIINSTGDVLYNNDVNFDAGVAQTIKVNQVLIPGTYTVDVAANILNYESVKYNTTYVVDYGVIYYSIAVTNIVYGGASPVVTLTTTIPGSEATLKRGYAIYFNDGTSPICYINGDDTDKEFNLYDCDIDALAAGNYTVKVVPITTDPEFKYYNLVESNTTTFEVQKAEVTFNIEVNSPVKYPNNVTVKIIESNVAINYTVTVGDNTQEVAVEANTNKEVNFENLAIGTYSVSVTSNNANYTTVTKTGDVVVTYGPLNPQVANVEAYYLEDAVVVVKSAVDGEYIVTVADKPYTVNVANGAGNVTLDVLAAGSYNIKLTANIKDYEPYLDNNIATVTIAKAGVGLTIEVTNVTYPENATATVSANVTGTYTITIGGETYDVNITTNPGTMVSETVVLNILDANDAGGSYEASVDATVIDANFTAEPATCNFVVNKATPVIYIDIDDTYSVHDNVTVIVTVPYGTGQVTISSDVLHPPQVVDLENNTANYTIVDVSAFGEHVVTVTLDDDNFIAGGLSQATFNVTTITPILNITFNDAVYGQEAIITINVANNNTVDPDGLFVIANVGTQVASKEPVEFSLGDELAAGEYTLNITFTGDSSYAYANELFTFTISKLNPAVEIIAVTNATYPDNATITFSCNATGNFTIEVIDAEGNIQTIDVGAVEKGDEKTVNIPGLTAGKYTANVNYIANVNFTSAVNSTEFAIAQAVATIDATVIPATYPDKATVKVIATQDGTYTITVIDKDGNVVDTQTGDLVANENATAELSQIAAGTYTVNVAYTNDNFTAEPVQKDLTISKGAATITIETDGATFPETAIVNITSDATGDFTVTIGTFTTTGTFAGETVSVEAAGLGANTYDVVVDYAGNDNYNATTATGSLVIAKAAPVIYMEVDTTTILENATLTITIPYATGNVKVNGEIVELVDGVAKYNIGTLKAETYELTAIYEGNDNLTSGNNFTSFTVDKLPSNLVVTIENTTYGVDPVMVITIDNKENIILTSVIDGAEEIFAMTNGTYSKALTGLSAGDHTVTISYEGSDVYEADTASVTFNVGKATINVDVSAAGVTYPADVVVTVTADVAGKYNVTVNGVTEEVELAANTAKEVPFSGLAAGTFDVTVSREATEDYNAVSKTVNVTVAKATPVITVTSSGATYPADVVATVTSDVSGKYTVALGDEIKEIDLVAGVAQDVAFEKVNAGNYTVTAAYAETENYTAASATADVSVAKGTVTLTITAGDVAYPNDVVVTVTADVAGNYTLALGTTTPETIALEAGVAKDVTYSGLTAGTYTFTVASAETDNYNAAEATATATVGKATITVTIAADNVTYPADVVVTVTADVAGEYNLTIGTETEAITLEAGVAKAITKSGLTAGTYDITVARAESDNYAAVTQTASVNVAKSENTTITVEATSPSAGENATVTVTVPADATGTVTVKYGNGVYTADVVNGTATVSVPTAAAGTQTATVEYSGDANYASASSEVQITVKANGKIIAENIKRGVNSPYDYLATLVDNEGNPISGVEITFTILDQTYKATTNASGIATVSAGLTVVDGAATQYYVTVTNPYTLENTTATTTIVPRLIVLSGDLTADYLENPAYTVQAFGDDGEAVGAGEIVQFVFAGKTYEIATNESGIAVRTIGLAPGQYAVKACYAGYNTTATVFKVNQVMKVTSGTLKKTAKSYTLKATLKSSDGKALAGKEVTLTFNGKKYTVTTDSKGVASYTIKSSVISKLKAGKTYTLYARYVNDVVKGKIKVVSK